MGVIEDLMMKAAPYLAPGLVARYGPYATARMFLNGTMAKMAGSAFAGSPVGGAMNSPLGRLMLNPYTAAVGAGLAYGPRIEDIAVQEGKNPTQDWMSLGHLQRNPADMWNFVQRPLVSLAKASTDINDLSLLNAVPKGLGYLGRLPGQMAASMSSAGNIPENMQGEAWDDNRPILAHFPPGGPNGGQMNPAYAQQKALDSVLGGPVTGSTPASLEPPTTPARGVLPVSYSGDPSKAQIQQNTRQLLGDGANRNTVTDTIGTAMRRGYQDQGMTEVAARERAKTLIEAALGISPKMDPKTGVR